MKIHLPWIRVTAVAVVVATAGVHEAAAQYVPYRPLPQQQPAYPPQQVAPQAPAAQSYSPYTAYRQQPAQAAYQPQPTPAYSAPATAYRQPTPAYPQYGQAAPQYPATNYGAYPYVAHQPAPAKVNEAPLPNPQPANGATPANGHMHANGAMPATQNGYVNGGAYGAGDYYGAGAAGGCNTCGDAGVSNYCDDGSCNETQWFGGVYVLGMSRTSATDVKLTSQMPTGGTYPYYPQPNATILTSRDVDFDFREGLEVRFGSTFTVGAAQPACQSGCNGYGYGYGSSSCNTCTSCAPPTTYAWEVAWWGISGDENMAYAMFNGTDRIYGMKSYVGVEHDRDGAGGAYAYRAANDYYDYQMPIIDPAAAPIPAGAAGYVRVVSQRVRTDFKAQNLELNLMRFPVCNVGCNSCNGCDPSGCNTNYTGYNDCGCEESCSSFSMYGSCGVRYFRADDDFMYGTQSEVYDGVGTYSAAQWLDHDIDVENTLIGPQVGWTTDYCYGKWNLFCNSTFGIFNNHASVLQRMQDEDGNWARFTHDGSNFNVRTSKDSVAFLGELRVGTAYDFSCHWRGVLAYRAVAISGLATADEQLQGNYADRWSVGLIDSDNSMIVHGAQVGAECRY